MKRGVSSVVGMILILAVLSTIVISVSLHKLPILEKRSEYWQEVEKIDSFSKLLDVYNGNNKTVQLDFGANSPIVQTYEDSQLKVKKVGSIKIILNTTSGNKVIYGRFFAINLSIYPSKMPYIKIIISEGGLMFSQSNVLITQTSPYNYINESVKDPKLLYVDNFKLEGYKDVAGNGLVSVSISNNCKKVNYSNVSYVAINVTGFLSNYWKEVLLKKGFINIGHQYIFYFTKPEKVNVIYRNYSICIW